MLILGEIFRFISEAVHKSDSRACDFDINVSFYKNGLTEMTYEAGDNFKMRLDLKCMRSQKKKTT